MTGDEKKEIREDFRRAVNMTHKELEDWLQIEESRSVGWTREGESEAVGHQSGRRIIQLKHKKMAELDEDNYAYVRKVVGYVHRHRRSVQEVTSPAPAGATP